MDWGRDIYAPYPAVLRIVALRILYWLVLAGEGGWHVECAYDVIHHPVPDQARLVPRQLVLQQQAVGPGVLDDELASVQKLRVVCQATVEPVCGCDGITYDNACVADVNVNHDGA